MPIGDIQLNNEAIDRDYAGYPGANAGGGTDIVAQIAAAGFFRAS